jgi:hypothetical protein
LIQRFGVDVAKTCKIGLQIDQELTKRIHLERREKHEALILMRSIENNDPGWHNRLDSWLHEVRESYRIGFQKVREQWLQIRKNMLREGPCQKGTIETLFYEPCGNRWRISKLKCTAPYHPKMLFEEVASWLQYDIYDLSGWEIFDEEGKVDIDAQREPRHGERYIILSPDISEELRSSMEARFKKFLQATRWRRIKSRYKIEVFQEEPKEEPGFETVEEAIHRKHVRYRTRWKQKRKILAQPLESSPLCNDFTSPDETPIQDQIQTPTHSGWGRVGYYVESPFERRRRVRRSSLGRTERGESRDFETQSSGSRLIEDPDRFKGQEDMDPEPNVTDAQLCVHDHDASTPELVRPLREDQELDDRFQAPYFGTKGLRTRLSDSDELSLRQSRVDSKVTEGTGPTR